MLNRSVKFRAEICILFQTGILFHDIGNVTASTSMRTEKMLMRHLSFSIVCIFRYILFDLHAIVQSSFSRHVFLLDFLTDLKLHRTDINFVKNCPQWCLNSQPPDHQSYALPTELSHYLVVCVNH